MDKIKAFLLGMWQFRSMNTWADPKRPDHYFDHTDLDDTYDWGREWAHRLTFRYFEQE